MEKPGIIREVNERLGIVTDFYKLTLSHDPEVRLALQQSAFRNEEVSAPGDKPATFKEAQAERARLESGARSETAVKREWDEHRRSVPGWNDLSDEKRQQERDSWTPSGFTSEPPRNPDGTERRRGFFSLVLEMLANALLGGFKKNLSTEKI